MKAIRFLLIIQILFASFIIANGQALITKSDSISLKKDTLVTFIVPEYRGGIQWQKSSDGTYWRNIDGKNEDFLVVEINEEYSFRAMISDGTCSPLYSDIARITFTKPEVKTIKVDSTRSFSSHLFAEIYNNGGSLIVETGFFVSDRLETLTAENNKIVNSSNHKLFENRVNGLKPSTQYYMCSFATNSKGTSYGDTLTFKTKEFSIAAIDLRDQNYEWDYWLVSNDSGYFFINLENGKPVSAYIKPIPDQEGFTVFLNDQGLPYKMVIDGFVLLFENFRDSLVDASIVYSSGQIEVFRDLNIDVEFSGLKNLYFSPNNEWTIIGLKTVGNALRIASCIASLASIPTGAGVILAGAACSSAMLSMISQAYDLETLELVFNNISELTDLLGCTSGDVTSCALLLAGTANSLLLYLVESTNNESVSSAQVMLRRPTITTTTISNIMQSTALGGGSVVSQGSSTVTARGVCWSTSPNPSTTNSKTTNGTGVGSFTSSLTGLTANTPYYVRAYATNSYGTAYGKEVTFTTSSTGNHTGTFTDARDNKTYQWVQIGDQTWMAENLAYLPSVSPSSQGSNTAPYYYVYGYQGTDVLAAKTTNNYKTFGVLYNWPAAMAACPSGWHLPRDVEWTQLENYLIANGYNYDGTTTGNKIAKSMAATTSWATFTGIGVIGNNLTLNNKSGFSALPGGYLDRNSRTFSFVNSHGFWWSSTEYGGSAPWYRTLQYSSTGVSRGYYTNNKEEGFSIRCVKDTPSTLPDLSISASVSGSILAGQSKQTVVTVLNTGGNLAYGSYVEAHLYLSKTSTLDSDKVQLWVSNNNKPDFPSNALNSNGFISVSVIFTVPVNIEAGNYYIIAVVDEVNYHPEGNETNNTQSRTITIPPSLPDLTVSANVTGSIQAGASIQIPVTVAKAGGNLTNGSYTEAHLYLSKTSTLSSEKVKLWASNNNTPDFPNSVLNTSSLKTVTATVTIPANTAIGNYYIIAVVDEVNYHPETNETNNTKSYPIIVTIQSTNQTGIFTDSRDERTYKWVKIGDQTWMAENLAYLPSVSPSSQGSYTAPYYYVYGYQGADVTAAKLHANYKIYGVLYNWPAAMAGAVSSSTNPSKVQGVCPAGWHLPSDEEWTQLENYLIANGYNFDGTTTGNKIAKSMAGTTIWTYYPYAGNIGYNLTLNNKSGFSALPGGFRSQDHNLFFDVGSDGWWWSSTEYRGSWALYRYLGYYLANLGRGDDHKAKGVSVRCVRD